METFRSLGYLAGRESCGTADCTGTKAAVERDNGGDRLSLLVLEG